jgi:hemerythrin-like domain-containing protein
MSDIKPIKRSEHIVTLSKDHHFSLLFCWKIRSGVKAQIEPIRIIKYVQYFWEQHMKPHFMAEETFLFTPVKDIQVEKALSQHAAIREQINSLSADAQDVVIRLSTLADMVDDHVRYEERELFPHLESILSNAQLETIGKALAVHDDHAKQDDYQDQFWMKNKSGR